MNTNKIITGDSFEELDELPENSVHAVVTDPPYGLAFMGRSWDDFEPKEYQEWCQKWAEKVLKVLKPGGHLLAFSGNRTHHRLFTGVEDAGFEIRDTLTWHYGNGFPKNTSALLKPATEFIVLSRAPFSSSVKDCVEKYGTGALNISECRIETEGERARMVRKERESSGNSLQGSVDKSIDSGTPEGTTTKGRYPSNVVFDETEAERLDAKNEHTKSDPSPRHNSENAHNDSTKYGDATEGGWTTTGHSDSGGPSRYFYTSKASKSERTEDGSIDNSHPTVKPQDLMEWLIKLVSREGQIVLDPFCGSGTTCKAAKELNRKFIGIEKQDKWADVARVRCNLTPNDPSVVRENENQQGLEQYE